MNLLARARRLRELGILGMNRRNTECILDLNPRERFPLVDDKKRMRDLCISIGVPTPAIYAVVLAHSALRHLPRLLEPRSDFVIKPKRGAGGRGVLVIVGRDGAAFVRHNGQRLELGEVHQHTSSIISGLFSLGGRPDEALIQQRVAPSPEFERVSYQGTADVRVIVYRNVAAMAMLRLPTRLSGGRANLHQGAIGAGVDLKTGRTTHAVVRNRVTERHPDTGESVVGFQVPCWAQILDMACRVSAATGLGYVGVDVVVDRTHGPLVLEANARPGLAIQIATGQGLIGRCAEIDRELAK
jgi:alpha-L-glutamate ligase-like protein